MALFMAVMGILFFVAAVLVVPIAGAVTVLATKGRGVNVVILVRRGCWGACLFFLSMFLFALGVTGWAVLALAAALGFFGWTGYDVVKLRRARWLEADTPTKAPPPQ